MQSPIIALIELVNKLQKPNMAVAEIGVWEGDTCTHYLPTIKSNNGTFIAVDWFCGNVNIHEGTHSHQPDRAEQTYNNFIANVSNIDCLEITTILRGNSQEMAHQIPDKSLDICFIDANHTYDGCKKDILAYMNKVKSGGVLCGHDCEDISLANTFTPEQLNQDWLVVPNLNRNHGCHPGVIQAVYEVFGCCVDIIPDSGPHGIPIWVKQF